MSRNYIKSAYDRPVAANYKNYQFLGQGRNGRVYLMPDGRAVKVFKKASACKEEYEILKAVEGSRYFPKVFTHTSHYIIREYVGGTNLYEYLNSRTLTRDFVIRIANLVDELKALGFKKLNLRFSHLFVQKDGSLMLIDPRKSFKQKIPYPKSFLISLWKIGLLGKFLKILEEERPDLNWNHYLDSVLRK